MTDEASSVSPEEEALAGMFRALDRPLDGERDLQQAELRHPHLASEIRGLDAIRRMLDRARPGAEQPLPAKLGEFRIVRRLETGGMGEVYEAWQESLHRRVAVKVLRRGQHSVSAQERFMREQLVLARLHQTNIVPIHTAGREGSFEYFAMPFIDGAALRHVVLAAVELGSSHPGTKTPSIADLIRRAIADKGDSRTEAPMTPAIKEIPPRAVEFRPSLEYLRSVARVMADAAQAVQHAHEQGVLHRDIKPANIMVEAYATADGRRADQCWVIDFGLASYRSEVERSVAGAPTARRPHGTESTPSVSGVMGTPAYMAPEQFHGRADERADVWGLGVTLFEMLTLRPAFPVPEAQDGEERLAALRAAVMQAEPSWPPGLVPRDLQAICCRALRKDPVRRYATAGEVADDLRRWLRGEAVMARCQAAPWAAPLLRTTRWAARNRGWAAALGTTLVAVLVIVLAGLFAADTRRRAAERTVMIQQLEFLVSQPRMPGWSEKARQLALRVPSGSDHGRLRDTFASTLAGLDARRIQGQTRHVSSMAFDRAGDRLLLGGAPAVDERPAQLACTWEGPSEPRPIGLDAPGPVAFLADGTPVQFVHLGGLDYRLRDMARDADRTVCSLADLDPALDRPVVTERELPVMAMAADVSLLAASLAGPAASATEGGSAAVVAWDAATGRALRWIPIRATALALSSAGRLLAAGDRHGNVSVWDVASGDRLVELVGEDTVQSLAFGVHPLGSEVGGGREFQLAIGCASGRVTVWDSVRRRERSRCRGLSHRVAALEFSADGALLAAGGSGARIWDAATGATLLEFWGTFVNAVAFAPDGRQLALADYPSFGSPGDVSLWELHNGRGIRCLGGLDTFVHVVVFSPDGQRVAALSNDWRVGVWEVATGKRLMLSEAPKGYLCDNAALAFSRSGSQLACLTGEEVRLWDIASAVQLRSWSLPKGLADMLVFDAQDQLIAARCERQRATDPPSLRNAVLRVRNLSRPDGEALLFERRDFDAKVTGLVLDPHGRYVVVEGVSLATGVRRRSITAFEVPSGNVIWSVPAEKSMDFSSLRVDPTGEYVSFKTADGDERVLVTMPDGMPVPCVGPAQQLGPHADVLLAADPDNHPDRGTLFYHRDSAVPFLRLRHIESGRSILDASGERVACGSLEGTVYLVDLAQVRASLSAVGLDWKDGR